MVPEVKHGEFKGQRYKYPPEAATEGDAFVVVADRAQFPGEFRFRAKHETATYADGQGDSDIWSVKLDHQCDSWNISYGRHGRPYEDESLDEMIHSMDVFIGEATAVRAWLVGQRT